MRNEPVGCAATYAYHLTQSHAFIDGNKRIAAAITETFLETNGAQLTMTNDEIVQLFLQIASDAMSRDQIEQVNRTFRLSEMATPPEGRCSL